MKKKVKARKEHQCGCCENIIKAGEYCWYEEGREPVIEVNDGFHQTIETQIGIEYWKSWHCLDEAHCRRRFYDKRDSFLDKTVTACSIRYDDI